ncbi:conserved protein of unknown function [Tenacibaculum sp. 190130A14a]|uniref:Uncharacterized protein n=1 Tax=Tenacibaculum polynesiense TaxID=3137857 RepID=A0ABP1EX96_9FLAO
MAKINSVQLTNIPKEIIVGNKLFNLNVQIEIECHKIDLQLEMEYYLHAFIYDVKGKLDTPVLVPNWNNSFVFPIAFENSDEYLGKTQCLFTTNKKSISISLNIDLMLGKLKESSFPITKRLEAYVAIIPAIGVAGKHSSIHSVNMLH